MSVPKKKFEPWRPREIPRVFRSLTGEGEDRLIDHKRREPPSIVSSATSSNASVATTSGSTSSLIGLRVKQYLGRQPTPVSQRELNILLASQVEENTMTEKKVPMKELEDPVEEKIEQNSGKGIIKQGERFRTLSSAIFRSL